MPGSPGGDSGLSQAVLDRGPWMISGWGAAPAFATAPCCPAGRPLSSLSLRSWPSRSGWDGVFVWEAAYGPDAWSMLAAMATRTSRVRLGTMLTPLPWRRPWKVASQVATLDQLSDGRAVLAVGRRRARHRPARHRRGHGVRGPGRPAGRGHRPHPDALGRRPQLPRPALRLRDRPSGPVCRGHAGPGPDPDLGRRRLACAPVDAAGAALRRRSSRSTPELPVTTPGLDPATPRRFARG